MIPMFQKRKCKVCGGWFRAIRSLRKNRHGLDWSFRNVHKKCVSGGSEIKVLRKLADISSL